MKGARLAAGLSQEELARRLNLSVFTISRLERGAVKRLNVETMLRIARALDVPIAELLEGA